MFVIVAKVTADHHLVFAAKMVGSKAVLFLCALNAALVGGCSDLRLLSKTPDVVVSARTMDFKIDLHTLVESVPRGTLVQELVVQDCKDCPDYGWRTKYGFVGFNTLGINAAADGLNEKGLSAAYLVLAETTYPAVNLTAGHLPIVSSFVTYILGNFATVDQVRDGLQHVQLAGFDAALQDIVGTAASLQKESFPLHLSVHDAAGKSIVIEFLHGEMKIYDNPGGVLTNEPPFQDQLALVKQHDKANGMRDESFVGGYSPTERFQRLTYLNRHPGANFISNTSYSAATIDQAAISKALHMINTVAIPTAYIGHGGPTQYTVVRDHRNLQLYFQSNENQVLRRIDLEKIDFNTSSNRRAISVNFVDWSVDATEALLQSTVSSKDMPPRSVIEKLLHNAQNDYKVTKVAAHSTDNSSFWLGLVVGSGGTVVLGTAVVALVYHRRDPAYTPLL
ncbi:unnamed protein product [Aphanomyces euteiches]